LSALEPEDDDAVVLFLPQVSFEADVFEVSVDEAFEVFLDEAEDAFVVLGLDTLREDDDELRDDPRRCAIASGTVNNNKIDAIQTETQVARLEFIQFLLRE
jgi:hypothetical protein